MTPEAQSSLNNQANRYLGQLGTEARGIMRRYNTQALEGDIPYTRVFLPFYLMEELIAWDGLSHDHFSLDNAQLLARASNLLRQRLNSVFTNQSLLGLVQGLKPLNHEDSDYLKATAREMVLQEASNNLVYLGQSLADDLNKPKLSVRVRGFLRHFNPFG